MAIARLFQSCPLTDHSEITLDERAYHYVARVLRANVGDSLILFNGQAGEYQGAITSIDKKHVRVSLTHFSNRDCESPLDLHVAQGISRGEKMDFTIQKAVELGVKKITPLFTERCNIKLDSERIEKRREHWQSVVISACEQCGRTKVPEVAMPLTLEKWWQTVSDVQRLVLSPLANQKLSEIIVPTHSSVVLLIGPEGGLSDNEMQRAAEHNFLAMRLGARVLRTETAALAAIAALQGRFGDF